MTETKFTYNIIDNNVILHFNLRYISLHTITKYNLVINNNNYVCYLYTTPFQNNENVKYDYYIFNNFLYVFLNKYNLYNTNIIKIADNITCIIHKQYFIFDTYTIMNIPEVPKIDVIDEESIHKKRKINININKKN